MSDSRNAPVIPLPRPQMASSLTERDDEALMFLVAGEHRLAFEVLVGRYLARLTNYCVKFVGNCRTGEELAQEILFEVWVQRRRYHSKSGFPVFLFSMARNRCLNLARDERRRRRWNVGPTVPERSDGAPAEAPDQLDALLERERLRQVRAALIELPPKLREAVLLRFDQGLEYAEIACIVGRPESTVRSRVFLAMKRLRQTIAGDGET
jgi:RNA polymerase sigma-70 factor (ECF subfamily)